MKAGISMPAEDMDAFIQEAAVTRKLKHKYIVEYVGVGKCLLLSLNLLSLLTRLGRLKLLARSALHGPGCPLTSQSWSHAAPRTPCRVQRRIFGGFKAAFHVHRAGA